jgi:hypothetical protein
MLKSKLVQQTLACLNTLLRVISVTMASNVVGYNKDEPVKKKHRLADVSEESLTMLSPIQSHENMPLGSLEETIEPLVCLPFDIRRMIKTEKAKFEQPTDGLSCNEAALIMLCFTLLRQKLSVFNKLRKVKLYSVTRSIKGIGQLLQSPPGS